MAPVVPARDAVVKLSRALLARLAGATRTLHQGLHQPIWHWHARNLQFRRHGRAPEPPLPVPAPGAAAAHTSGASPAAEAPIAHVPFAALQPAFPMAYFP
eukprot:1768728-Alexandrium_andersonii.AAC.1